MFTLVNPSGNAQRVVRSEVKKEALLKEGWKPVEPPKAPKNKRKGASAGVPAEEE